MATFSRCTKALGAQLASLLSYLCHPVTRYAAHACTLFCPCPASYCPGLRSRTPLTCPATKVASGSVLDYNIEKCIDDDGHSHCSKPFLVSKSTCYKISWSTDGVLSHTTAEVRDAGSNEIVYYRDTDGEWTPEKGEVSAASSSVGASFSIGNRPATACIQLHNVPSHTFVLPVHTSTMLPSSDIAGALYRYLLRFLQSLFHSDHPHRALLIPARLPRFQTQSRRPEEQDRRLQSRDLRLIVKRFKAGMLSLFVVGYEKNGAHVIMHMVVSSCTG